MNEVKNAEKYLKKLLLNGKMSVEEFKDLAIRLIQQVCSSENSNLTMNYLFLGINVGWYAFAGGRFSPNPKAYPNCQGVIGWLNPNQNAPEGKRGLIVTPDEFRGVWSESEYAIKCGEEDGKSNTEKILAYGKKGAFPAAEWCARYDKNGVQPGEGFFLAKAQLVRIVANREIVNPALEKIGGKKLQDWILSSSEYKPNPRFVWLVNANNGITESHYKDYPHRVRCVIPF